MRGKKADPVFISQFIQESVQSGMDTPDQIVQRAKDMINQIDEEIRAVEIKKATRSKLIDVIASFEKQTKDKSQEAKLLPLFDLEYPETCKYLCEIIEKQPIPADPKLYSTVNDPKNIFAVKQLLERKVIAREGNQLIRGERFDDYMKFVLGK
jgi:secreted Zn-dependent insulinase-like peptidase